MQQNEVMRRWARGPSPRRGFAAPTLSIVMERVLCGLLPSP
jgi:hypothetical protein